jgi:3-phosphoshikimate 1-carboxyvinyltransferase
VTIGGTARMRERPIGPLVDALRSLGAEVHELGATGFPPLVVRGPLAGGDVVVDGSVSSQFVSAILLAAPFAAADVTVRLASDVVSRPYLDGTVAVLGAWGVEVVAHDHGWTVRAAVPAARDVVVEPDASAAVYPWVGAAMTGGDVLVEGLRRDGSQADLAVLDVLESMGADVVDGPSGIRVRGRRPLRGVDVDLGDAPDGALAVAVAAAAAEGPSRLGGLATLRVKETDRLAALETELRRVGATATTGPDRLRVDPGPLHGAVVHTYDDHRIAMSFALLGLVVPGIEIEDPGCVAKTWPGYFDVLAELAVPVADVIAIDGPAGTGKTTVSTAVADRLGRLRLDTGAFYRAATLVSLRDGIPPGPDLAAALAGHTFSFDEGVMAIDGEDVSAEIRTPEVTERVSAVSAVPEVRERMVDAQRDWVASSGVGVVVEGRDIGTVVFPGAVTKVYLDARPEVRAARRAAELGTDPAEEESRIRARDRQDSGRATSPLRPADDAWHLDTSDRTIDEVVAAIVDHHRGRVG